MSGNVSQRLIDQRVRNLIISAVATLSDGDRAVRREGMVEYFEAFFDVVPHRDHHRRLPENSAFSEEERALLELLSDLVDDACDATAPVDDDEEFIATGWAQRIQPEAGKVLQVMLRRGRFSSEVEEAEPAAGGN